MALLGVDAERLTSAASREPSTSVRVAAPTNNVGSESVAAMDTG